MRTECGPHLENPAPAVQACTELFSSAIARDMFCDISRARCGLRYFGSGEGGGVKPGVNADSGDLSFHDDLPRAQEKCNCGT